MSYNLDVGPFVLYVKVYDTDYRTQLKLSPYITKPNTRAYKHFTEELRDFVFFTMNLTMDIKEHSIFIDLFHNHAPRDVRSFGIDPNTFKLLGRRVLCTFLSDILQGAVVTTSWTIKLTAVPLDPNTRVEGLVSYYQRTYGFHPDEQINPITWNMSASVKTVLRYCSS